MGATVDVSGADQARLPPGRRRRPAACSCLAAPSGGGKTSLVAALLEREPGIRLSVSYTTRAPRPGEIDGVHYHFVDEPRFLALKARRVPRARVRPRQLVRDVGDLACASEVAHGHDVLLEIDWQGAAQVRRLIPAPSTSSSCRRRSHRSRSGSKSAGRTRPKSSCGGSKRRAKRCATVGEFDYVIMNQDFARAVDDLSRDRARGAPDRAAAGGAPRAAPAALARTLNLQRIPWPASRSTTVSRRFPTASS